MYHLPKKSLAKLLSEFSSNVSYVMHIVYFSLGSLQTHAKFTNKTVKKKEQYKKNPHLKVNVDVSNIKRIWKQQT